MKREKIFAILNISLGIVIAIAPFILFPVCEALKADGTRMNCFYSAIFITSMGILIIILQFVRFSSILSSVAALMCWFVPNEVIKIPPFGLCADPSHACRNSTMPFVGIIVTLIIILNVASMIIKFVKGGK